MSRSDLLDRRDFLRALPCAVAGIAAASRGAAGLALDSATGSFDGLRGLGPNLLDPVGIQLYTVRGLMSDDPEGTLAALARIGYREIEFAGLYGKTPAEMRGILDGLGLRAVSSHNSLREIRESWSATLEGAATLGQSYVVCPSIGRNERTLEGLRAVADTFNRAGEAARAAGLRFGYHNHDWEFEPIEGVRPFDLLLERCDPDLVVMQMDLFWVVNGGSDPLDYFGAHPGRFPLVHAKDRTPDGAMVNVGEGAIDFPAIYARAEQAGIRHTFVEHDRPSSPLEDVRVSYEYLSGMEA